MISKEFLEILRCPVSRRRLQLVAPELLEPINHAIARGQLRNRAGETLEEPLDGGLVDEDQTLLYPICDDIPCLLADEAIELKQLSDRGLDKSEEPQ